MSNRIQAGSYVWRIVGPDMKPLSLSRRILPQAHFLNDARSYARASVLRERHGIQASVQRSLPVQFPETVADG